jgi:5'-3' exonuclease
MGVKDFWSLFGLSDKKAKGIHPIQVESLTRDKTVGVDGSAVIHKAFSQLDTRLLDDVAQALYMHEGEDALGKSLGDCLHDAFSDLVECMYKQFGFARVIFVFDGQILPGKREEKTRRLDECREYFKEAWVFAKAGDKAKKKDCLRKSLYISWDVYKISIAICRALSCNVYVAVTEADSQLAYMNALGEIDVILGEDGDFFIHGAKEVLAGFISPRKTTGKNYLPGAVVSAAADLRCLTYTKSEQGKSVPVPIDTSQWDAYDILLLAICLGCDYGTIAGVGAVKAVAIVEAVRSRREANHTYEQWFCYVEDALRSSTFVRAQDVDKHMEVVQKCALSFRTQLVYNTQVISYWTKQHSLIGMRLKSGNLSLQAHDALPPYTVRHIAWDVSGNSTHGVWCGTSVDALQLSDYISMWRQQS